MTIYVFSGFYSISIIGAKTEKRAREMLQCDSSELYKLTNTYEEGEEFIESYKE